MIWQNKVVSHCTFLSLTVMIFRMRHAIAIIDGSQEIRSNQTSAICEPMYIFVIKQCLQEVDKNGAGRQTDV